MNTSKIKPLPLKNTNIQGSFWSRYAELIRDKVIPYQWEALNDRVPDAAKSHCIKNFEIVAGRHEGDFYGMCFQDSDLYKWLESVAYSLDKHPDKNLEKLADEAIELIGAAQTKEGYINTYYQVKEPKARWTNLQQGHELYCAGHLIEAAVAYFDATNKRNFLDIAIRFADYIDEVFGISKMEGYPGHQEIELALYKLYETTNEARYLNLAAYFIKQRAKQPNYFDLEEKKPEYKAIWPEISAMPRTYTQSHISAAEQTVATGHAVRAVYMYCAMADLAIEMDDKELAAACDILYEDVTTKQMYITGAIGSLAHGERFSSAYDLPNDLIYGETCASVGLMMFCRRMNILRGKGEYADVMELALYNTVLAGISLAGTEFYYVNPLEVEPEKIKHSHIHNHVKPVRQKWFDCACCPSNLARTIMGLGLYAYAHTNDSLYVNLYCEGSADDNGRKIEVHTMYPFENTANIKASGGRYKLYLRNPGYAPATCLKINNEVCEITTQDGYIIIERNWVGDEISLEFDMKARYVYSALEVQNNIGKAAVMRGPIVYCAEEADNTKLLGAYALDAKADILAATPPEGLLPEPVALKTTALRYSAVSNGLYTTQKPELQPTELKMIPYFEWANRGENEMRVFLPIV